MKCKDLVFRRLYPIPEWDALIAEYWDTGHNGSPRTGKKRWELTLSKGLYAVCKLPYALYSINEVIMEAEALGCNVSAYRHLLMDEPICSSSTDLES
jgi:hypothetical protein